MSNKRIVIIGGGPAGMMAAIAAGSSSPHVTLLEKNRSLGKKLLLTGNGRCNLTNMIGPEGFFAEFGKNGPFLRDSFSRLSNTDLMSFFEDRGLKCFPDPAGKVFPHDNRSSSVLSILKKELIRKNVTVQFSSAAKKILLSDNTVRGVELMNGRILKCAGTILATGGISYPSTGSTGDGYELAEKAGHTITPLLAGLVPVITKEKYPSLLSGLSLRGVRIKVSLGKKSFLSPKGDIVFTSDGISGPALISSSSSIARSLKQDKKVCLKVDQFPDLSPDEVDSLIIRTLDKHGARSAKNSLKELLNQRIAELFLAISKVDSDKTSGQITKKERHALSSLCKSFAFTVAGTASPEEAMITCGGISLKEIDPRTMSSRLINGLFFAGEIVDLDGGTGGFNLQAAFSTGHLAGSSAARI